VSSGDDTKEASDEVQGTTMSLKIGISEPRLVATVVTGRRRGAAALAMAALLFAPSCGGDEKAGDATTVEAVFAADVRLPESAAQLLRNRIDAAHLDDASFDVSGDRRTLSVQVPDSEAGRAVLDGLSTIGVVEFRPVLEMGTTQEITPADQRRPDAEVVLDGQPKGTHLLLGPSALPEGAVRAAHAEDVAVAVVFTPEGTAALNALAAAQLGRQLAIVVDGEVVSAPTLQSADFGSEVTISGQFTRSEAEALAKAIAGGPVHLRRRKS
jgi:preprotein translocase subunit SecD